MQKRKIALLWGCLFLTLVLVLLAWLLHEKYFSPTYAEGHFTHDEPGLLVVSYDPAFHMANNPHTPRVAFYSLPMIRKATAHWDRQKKWFEEYQRSSPPPESPESKTPRLGGVHPTTHWIGKMGTLGYNAFLLRSEDGADYYRINVCRRGVMYVMDEFRYAGEDFVTVMRGEDWYVAFTRRFNNTYRPAVVGKEAGHEARKN